VIIEFESLDELRGFSWVIVYAGAGLTILEGFGGESFLVFLSLLNNSESGLNIAVIQSCADFSK
jgi:hypothetical protein